MQVRLPSDGLPSTQVLDHLCVLGINTLECFAVQLEGVTLGPAPERLVRCCDEVRQRTVVATGRSPVAGQSPGGGLAPPRPPPLHGFPRARGRPPPPLPPPP